MLICILQIKLTKIGEIKDSVGLGTNILHKVGGGDVTHMVDLSRDLKEVKPPGRGEFRVMGIACAKVLSDIQVACVLLQQSEQELVGRR